MTEEMLQAIKDRMNELGFRPKDIAYFLDKDYKNFLRILKGEVGTTYGYLVKVLDFLGMEIIIEDAL